jgi:hypothetical protein
VLSLAETSQDSTSDLKREPRVESLLFLDIVSGFADLKGGARIRLVPTNPLLVSMYSTLEFGLNEIIFLGLSQQCFFKQ